MGLTEVLTHLPRLMRLRVGLRRQILEWRPDVFVGVDFKEFNLGLAKQLKRAGLTTVQYVSPQVWAWRQGRVRTIGASVDLVLCLFPFEPDFYREHGVRAAFVGHPLADQIPLAGRSRRGARRARHRRRRAACSPYCRAAAAGEVEKLAEVFAGAAELLARPVPGSREHRAHGDARAARAVRRAVRAARAAMPSVRLLDGQARLALAAADVVLVASGTATLEAALSETADGGRLQAGLDHRVPAAYARAREDQTFLAAEPARGQGAGAGVLPGGRERRESGERARALALRIRSKWREVQQEFAAIHAQLRCNGAERAAAEIGDLLASPDGAP